MFIYTLLMLVLPHQGGLEYTVQHFDSPKECQEAGHTLIMAYAREFEEILVIPNCVQGFKT